MKVYPVNFQNWVGKKKTATERLFLCRFDVTVIKIAIEEYMNYNFFNFVI